MSYVEFEDQKIIPSPQNMSKDNIPSSKMVLFVMKIFGVNEKVGQIILVTVVTALFLASFFVLRFSGDFNKTDTLYMEDIPQNVREGMHPATLNSFPSRNK
jgi:hypothetical protein